MYTSSFVQLQAFHPIPPFAFYYKPLIISFQYASPHLPPYFQCFPLSYTTFILYHLRRMTATKRGQQTFRSLTSFFRPFLSFYFISILIRILEAVAILIDQISVRIINTEQRPVVSILRLPDHPEVISRHLLLTGTIDPRCRISGS